MRAVPAASAPASQRPVCKERLSEHPNFICLPLAMTTSNQKVSQCHVTSSLIPRISDFAFVKQNLCLTFEAVNKDRESFVRAKERKTERKNKWMKLTTTITTKHFLFKSLSLKPQFKIDTNAVGAPLSCDPEEQGCWPRIRSPWLPPGPCSSASLSPAPLGRPDTPSETGCNIFIHSYITFTVHTHTHTQRYLGRTNGVA